MISCLGGLKTCHVNHPEICRRLILWFVLQSRASEDSISQHNTSRLGRLSAESLELLNLLITTGEMFYVTTSTYGPFISAIDETAVFFADPAFYRSSKPPSSFRSGKSSCSMSPSGKSIGSNSGIDSSARPLASPSARGASSPPVPGSTGAGDGSDRVTNSGPLPASKV